jgi:hypothetical protein
MDHVKIISSMNLKDPNLRPNDGGFQSVDPGTYDFEITKVATGTSNAGNNTLKVTGQVVGPEGNPMMGRTMVNSYLVNDSDFARGRMLSFLTASNAVIDDNGGFDTDQLVGLSFTADVEKRAGKTIDKMGNEVERDFTSWVRERPVGADVGQAQAAAPPPAQPPPAQPTKPTSNAPRRPQSPPSGNGARAGR